MSTHTTTRAHVFGAATDAGLTPRLAELVASVDIHADVLGRGPVVVGSDLDRTLIFSTLALELGDVPVEQLVVAEHLDGRPQAYWTADAHLMLRALMQVATFVPTTTRTLSQFSRVELPASPQYAVAANGGQLLVDGAICPRWAAHVREQLALCAPLDEVVDHLRQTSDPSWVIKHGVADNLFTYLIVERALMPAEFVSDLTAWCAQRGWVVSFQGRKVYAVPTAVTKSAAVREVARRTGAGLVLSAGDSLLDIDLLEAADVGIRPAHGELHVVNWSADHVSITSRAGPLAGQEIVTWLLAHALAAAPRRTPAR